MSVRSYSAPNSGYVHGLPPRAIPTVRRPSFKTSKVLSCLAGKAGMRVVAMITATPSRIRSVTDDKVAQNVTGSSVGVETHNPRYS